MKIIYLLVLIFPVFMVSQVQVKSIDVNDENYIYEFVGESKTLFKKQKKWLKKAKELGATHYTVVHSSQETVYLDTNNSRTDAAFFVKYYKKVKRKNVTADFRNGILIDNRDGQEYKTFSYVNSKGETIIWMAQNLNYKTPRSFSYGNTKKIKKHFGGNEVIGSSYHWEDAMKACPDGWHLPSSGEWEELLWAFGGEDNAQEALKSSQGWKKKNGNNKSGFNAFPVGSIPSKGPVSKVGSIVGYWTSTSGGDMAYEYQLRHNGKKVLNFYNYKAVGNSCRCVKDQ